MVITTINNGKLFIQFDSLISSGLISVTDNNSYSKSITISNSNFEVMDLPLGSDTIYIEIIMGEKTITKTIKT